MCVGRRQALTDPIQRHRIAHSTAQGHGTFFADNGDTYEGEWLNGRRHGKGRAVCGGRAVDGFGGDVYEGYFEDDVK